MKQNLTADYLACILFKAAGLFTSFLPFNISLFMGRRLGDLIYLFDKKHRAVACANIRKTVAEGGDYKAARRLTRKAYRAFGQNLVEISFIPRINKQYLEKYIDIVNKEHIEAAFRRGKGVIFLAVHEGDWELSNIICANLGFPFVLFVRDQGFPRLNALLNSYRLKQGAKIIYKQAGPRQLVETVNKNQAIGMTMDQGGKTGELVKFFGKQASMSTGAVKLALKYDCSIIPTFYTRVKGPYIKVILDQVYTVTKSGDAQKDLRDNLQRLAGIYEKYIRLYPHEYLWTYKIWKYGRERELLILSDGKTGHLRQSESAAKLIIQQLSARGIKTDLSIREVKSREDRQGLMKLRPDIIISAGNPVSGLNYRLARQNQAKSIVLMRPGILGLKKFNLAIIPEHDNPPARKNVVVTSGALNLIDADYLKEKTERLKESGFIKGNLPSLCLGALVGGDSKGFSISGAIISGVISQIKRAAEELNADILLTTSRRTSAEVEQVIKRELGGYSRCKLLVIANENNHPDVVGGILGLSSIIITSPESISMISEAASAGKYVVVFQAQGLSRKHRRFLSNYHDKGYIYLSETGFLADSIKEIWKNRPQVCLPQDNLKVAEALNRIL